MKLRNSLLRSILVTTALCLSTSAAIAQTATLSTISEAGDYIGQGETHSYAGSEISSRVSTDMRQITVNVNSGTHWFVLTLAAPRGQALVVGVYNNATRWPFQLDTAPGLDYTGDHRGCNQSSGRFEITRVVYGAPGTILDLEATWEQHCEFLAPALHGQVSIRSQRPPTTLIVDVQHNAKASISRLTGRAQIAGTVTCSQAVTAQVSGTFTQLSPGMPVASGAFSIQTACSSTPRAWTAEVASISVPFQLGLAQLAAEANAVDSVSGGNVLKRTSGPVLLWIKK